MQRDTYFPHTLSEESSDIPQLAFPEPEQHATPGIQQLPFSEPGQHALSTIPQLAFPEPGQHAPSTVQQLPFSEPGQPDTIQLPFPEPATQPRSDALLTAVQAQQPSAAETPQIPFAQPLPSTETIDTTYIRFPQPAARVSEPGESVKLPFPRQHGETDEIMRIARHTFPQRSPISEPDGQTPFAATSGQMPGLIEIPFITQEMQTLKPDMPEEEEVESPPAEPGNQDAKRAIINGVISLVASIFTLTTIAGVAGLVIGTFAISYGLLGLRLARRLPDHAGRRQAIIGITLGLIAWCIVIAAFILRVPRSS